MLSFPPFLNLLFTYVFFLLVWSPFMMGMGWTEKFKDLVYDHSLKEWMVWAGSLGIFGAIDLYFKVGLGEPYIVLVPLTVGIFIPVIILTRLILIWFFYSDGYPSKIFAYDRFEKEMVYRLQKMGYKIDRLTPTIKRTDWFCKSCGPQDVGEKNNDEDFICQFCDKVLVKKDKYIMTTGTDIKQKTYKRLHRKCAWWTFWHPGKIRKRFKNRRLQKKGYTVSHREERSFPYWERSFPAGEKDFTLMPRGQSPCGWPARRASGRMPR